MAAALPREIRQPDPHSYPLGSPPVVRYRLDPDEARRHAEAFPVTPGQAVILAAVDAMDAVGRQPTVRRIADALQRTVDDVAVELDRLDVAGYLVWGDHAQALVNLHGKASQAKRQTPPEAPADSCSACPMPDRCAIYRPENTRRDGQRIVGHYRCSNGHTWTRGYAEAPLPAPAVKAPTALYRWFDADGVPIYYGISDHLTDRQSSHARRSAWGQFAHRCEVDRFLSRGEALRAEKAAIEADRPVFNRQHNDTAEARRRLREYLTGQGRTDLLRSRASTSAR